MGQSDTIIAHDIKGSHGFIRFEMAENNKFANSTLFFWRKTSPDEDFIVRKKINNLDKGKLYYYRCHFGKDTLKYITSETGRFRTIGGKGDSEPVRFVMVTGSNYCR